MTTIRRAHKKNYLVLTNDVSQDMSISSQSKGILVYLLSLPDDWKINHKHLYNTLPEGRYAITQSMNELLKKGYLHFVRYGFPAQKEYFVFDAPISAEEFKNYLQNCRFPEPLVDCNYKVHSNKQSTDPLPHSYTSYTHGCSPGNTQALSKIKEEYKEKVWLTKKQSEDLKKKYGEENFERMASKLSEYKKSSGRIYRCDKDVLNGWVKDWLKTQIGKEKRDKARKEEKQKLKEANYKIYKEVFSILSRSRTQRSGIEWIESEEMIRDNVLGSKYTSIYNPHLEKTLCSWYPNALEQEDDDGN